MLARNSGEGADRTAGAGDYELGGRRVCLDDGAVRLPDGTLAGSALTMDLAVRNAAKLLGVQFLVGGENAPFAATNYSNAVPSILTIGGAYAAEQLSETTTTVNGQTTTTTNSSALGNSLQEAAAASVLAATCASASGGSRLAAGAGRRAARRSAASA